MSFKIGDIVEIVKDWDGYPADYSSLVGGSGVVISINELVGENITYKVKFTTSDSWWYKATELLLRVGFLDIPERKIRVLNP